MTAKEQKPFYIVSKKDGKVYIIKKDKIKDWLIEHILRKEDITVYKVLSYNKIRIKEQITSKLITED